MQIFPVVYGENIGTICAGKCEITLHSCISVMVNINEQKTSIVYTLNG